MSGAAHLLGMDTYGKTAITAMTATTMCGRRATTSGHLIEVNAGLLTTGSTATADMSWSKATGGKKTAELAVLAESAELGEQNPVQQLET